MLVGFIELVVNLLQVAKAPESNVCLKQSPICDAGSGYISEFQCLVGRVQF